MGLVSDFRDRFLIKPVAEKILETLKPSGEIEKADTPNIFSVPIGFNGAMSTNNKKMVSAGTVDWTILRSLSINHETTRAAINTRKRQITQLEWDIVDVDNDADNDLDDPKRQELRELVTHLGGPGVRFRELLDKMIEDTLVLDACVFYKQKTRGGQLFRIIPVDATTIKLRVDQAGGTPPPPEAAFEQWIRGEKVAELTMDEMNYEMMNPRNNSPYGLSPIESLVITLDASMRAMLYNLSYLSDNSVPQGFLNVPEGWTVNQIKEYTEYLHALISGPKAQAKIYPIPSGATYTPTSKPTDFAFKDFFDYLDRKVCMLFDITPQELGLSLQQYKENAEGQDKIQLRKGIKPLANFLQEIFTDLIRNDLGYTNYAFKFVGLDPRFNYEEAKTLIPLGVVSVDEVRNDMGLKKIGVDNFIIAGNSVTPINMIGMTTVSGQVQTPPPEPAQKTESATNLQKLAKNLGLEAVEKSKKFKSFNKAVKSAIEEQIKPFTKESTIDSVTTTKKADISDESIEDEVTSIEINGLEDYLKWAAEQGGQNAYNSLNIQGVFSLTNPKFQQMLGDRANYLITSIDDTTKQWVVDQITAGKELKLTNSEIARKISDEIEEISASRADTIVNTEVANAMQVAELDTYKDQGIEKKTWVLSEDIGDECGENSGVVVGVDETFPTGDDAPPLHPNCRCFIQAVIEP
jgi:SPP1 gp7 family putative phage head morphogenesis protein